MSKERKHTILSTESDFLLLGSYFFNEEGEKISAFLNDKRHRLNNSTFSYRIINHWEKEGIISDYRPSGKGWRKFSLMDIVWLNIITELRRFGYPLDKIKDVKESLKYNSDSDKKREYPALEVCIAAAMNLNIPCFLLVFENGEALAVKYEEYKRSISFETIGNHIQINLNNILKKLYPNKKISPDFGISVRLSSEEADLLLMIRKGDFIEIKVKKRNGKIERLEATEMVKTDKRITEILKEGDYQNIEIKQQDGKISCIKRTIKKKL